MSTILIADDNAQNLYLTRFLLEERGHTILEAQNGQDAIDRCQQHAGIELVLMDIQMPVMGGLEATRHLKKMRPELLIVALSGKVMPEDRENILNAGCDGYIEKPIEPMRFPEQVESYCRPATDDR